MNAKNDFERDHYKLMNSVDKLMNDTDSFIMHIKTKCFYKDIAKDVEKKYDTSNYTVARPLPIGKN